MPGDVCRRHTAMPFADSHDLEAVILQQIRELADPQTGRPCSRHAFTRATGISANRLNRYFANWDSAVAAAGLTPNYHGRTVPPEVLLGDYGRVVRALRTRPTMREYSIQTRHSREALQRVCGPWHQIEAVFRRFAAREPARWVDVVELLDTTPIPPPVHGGGRPPGTHWVDTTATPAPTGPPPPAPVVPRPASLSCGKSLGPAGLCRAPLNEQGVVLLFGLLARQLGFDVLAVQGAFPDCTALREVIPGRWQLTRIEFEFESRNFVAHGHDPAGCDLIVCWRHNWADCPPGLEVLELEPLATAS
jgi:hypothetical protein